MKTPRSRGAGEHGAAESLTAFPKKGRPGRELDTRELVIQCYRYLIVYRLHSEAVEIWRVLHASQKFP